MTFFSHDIPILSGCQSVRCLAPVLRCPTSAFLYLDKIRFIDHLCMCYPGQTTFKLSYTKLFAVCPRAEFNVSRLKTSPKLD